MGPVQGLKLLWMETVISTMLMTTKVAGSRQIWGLGMGWHRKAGEKSMSRITWVLAKHHLGITCWSGECGEQGGMSKTTRFLPGSFTDILKDSENTTAGRIYWILLWFRQNKQTNKHLWPKARSLCKQPQIPMRGVWQEQFWHPKPWAPAQTYHTRISCEAKNLQPLTSFPGWILMHPAPSLPPGSHGSDTLWK